MAHIGLIEVTPGILILLDEHLLALIVNIPRILHTHGS